MRSAAGAGWSLLCLALGGGFAFGASADPSVAELDAAIEEQRNRHDVHGVVLALVEAGKPPILRAFGLADAARGVPMDTEVTLLHQGSVAKVLTAILVMRLVDRGLLDLDQVLAPEVRAVAPDLHGLTLAHLLANAAGIEQQGIGTATKGTKGFASLDRYLARRPPMVVAPPGKVPIYSSVGFAIAGLAAERATGTPFPELARREVFRPLEMTHSSVPVPPDDPDDLAIGYRGRADRLTSYEQPYFSLLAPGGDFVASAADMARLLASQFPRPSNGESEAPFLSGASLARMQRRHFSPDERLRGHALGWAEWWDGGRKALYHDGGAPGFLARVFLVPQEGWGFYLGVNRAYATGFLRRVTDDILDLFPAPAAESRSAARPPGPTPDLRTYCGSYRGFGTARSGLGKVNSLFDVVTVRCVEDGIRIGRGPLLRWRGDDGFGEDEGETFVLFGRAGGGGVTHLMRGGTGTLERVPWLEAPALHGWIALGLLMLFSAGACSVAVPRWRRRMPAPRWLGAVAGLQLLHMVALTSYVAHVLSTDPWWSLVYGPPPFLRMLLVLPWASLALAALLALRLARCRGKVRRLPNAIAWAVAIGAAVSLSWLRYWNLVTP